MHIIVNIPLQNNNDHMHILMEAVVSYSESWHYLTLKAFSLLIITKDLFVVHLSGCLSRTANVLVNLDTHAIHHCKFYVKSRGESRLHFVALLMKNRVH